MNPDISVQPRMRPPVFNQPRVEPEIMPSAPVLSTAAAVEQPAPTTPNVEPRTGAIGTAPAGRTRDRRNRGGDWRNRSGNSNLGSQNLGGQTGEGTWQNRSGEEGHRDRGDRDGNRRNWRERHRDWHERNEGDPNFDEKHRRFHRQHRNRDWWRRNYTRFVLFGGGYYYWNRGYWYPAYGYDPYYNTYAYDAPLYSYNGLSPGQVVAMVQSKLQQRGYYNAAVDGSFGPMTRQALMNYQADHGLPMTGEIDEETLNSLDFE